MARNARVWQARGADRVCGLFVLGEARGVTMRTIDNFLKTRVPIVGYLILQQAKCTSTKKQTVSKNVSTKKY